MKAADIIKTVQEARAGAENAEIMKYIREQEAKVSRYIGGFEGYEDNLTLPHNESDVLFLPEEYSDIYVLYCLCKVDFSLGEISDYTNDMIMYNTEWGNWKNCFIREHMPKPLYMGVI